MPPNGQSLYVFKDEVVCIHLNCQANELQQQSIARIVQRSLSHEREALAGSTAEYNVDTRAPQLCRLANICPGKSRCIGTNRGAFGEVELMDGTVHRIDLHSRPNLETGLLEAERQSSGPCKEVHTDRPSSALVLSPQETHRFALPIFAGPSIRTARRLAARGASG
jgi:hypothetical protein